ERGSVNRGLISYKMKYIRNAPKNRSDQRALSSGRRRSAALAESQTRRASANVVTGRRKGPNRTGSASIKSSPSSQWDPPLGGLSEPVKKRIGLLFPADGGFRSVARADPGFLGQKDRKSTRLNSSHVKISYAVFCLKKKIHE